MSQTEIVTQANYKPTEYAEQSWEIVGTGVGNEEFLPMEVEVLAQEFLATDPMFADYGGVSKVELKKRWHLPKELSEQDPQALAAKEAEVAVNSITLSLEQHQQLKQEGYDQGYQAAAEELQAEYQQKLELIQKSLTTVVQDLKQQLDEQELQFQKKAISLTLEISRKIIADAVEINPEYILPLIKEALSHTGSSSIHKIRVSKQDLEFIQLVGLEQQLKAPEAGWHFEADDQVKAGCIVETTAGEIDFQLDQAWQRVKDQIVKVIS